MENREGYKKTKIGCIPAEWAFCKISDITDEHKQGYYTKNPYTKNGTYLIRITDLENPAINFESMPKVDIDQNTYEQFKVEKEDFIFARSGTIGRYGIVESEKEAVFASYLIRFKFNQEVALNKFIGYFYESNFSTRQILSITQGSSNININANNIKSLNIPLPPLPEQQKIAEILTTVDDKISSIEERIQQTEQLKKGLMEKLLTEGIGHTEFKDTKIGRMPAGWDVYQFNTIVKKTQLGLNIKASVSNRGISILKMGNLAIGGFNFSKIERIPDNSIEKHGDFFLKYGDFLFNTRNTPELVGKSATWKSDRKMIFNNNILRIRFVDCIDSFYIGYYFSSKIGWSKLKSISKNTTSVGAIYTKDLLKIRIGLPPLTEQKQIATILSTVDEKLDVLQSKKSTFKTLKKGLMDQLLTGAMRVKV